MREPDPFTFDCHVHFGQYYHLYYQPSLVIKALCRNGVRRAWVSSTTACIAPGSPEEARYLSRHIDEEMEEAAGEANACNMTLVPLYWAVPRRYSDLDKADGVRYAGFKIHPKIGEWGHKNGQELLRRVCTFAAERRFPVLIHTGVDADDSPLLFEKYYADFPEVTFVLAHCRAPREIVRLFEKYGNLLGDTAFCPAESYEEICRAGFSPRMLWGTDFPITHWCSRTGDAVTLSSLSENYKKILQDFKPI